MDNWTRRKRKKDNIKRRKGNRNSSKTENYKKKSNSLPTKVRELVREIALNLFRYYLDAWLEEQDVSDQPIMNGLLTAAEESTKRIILPKRWT